MANRSLGTLTVDLIAKIGGFTKGMDEAERKADKTAREIARKQAQLAKQLDEAAKGIGVAFGAAVAGVGLAFAGIDRQIKSASVFKDLEEMTGASAEDLASLSVAAETAGVGMEALAGNSIRLTKNLTGVDDESKAAGSAIKALGLNLDDFKKLDPVGQIDALAKAFGSFEDGPQKSAVAIALWDKQGAEMIKVLNALEEQGGRVKIMTQEQIEAADAYADAQAKAGAELKLYAQAAATQAAPAFLALTNAASDFIKELIGVDKETGKLGKSTAIKDFAEASVKALAFIVDAADGVVRVFQIVGTSLGAGAATVSAILSGEFKQAIQIAAEGRAEIDRIMSKPFFSDKVALRLDQPEVAKPKTNRPALNFDGAVKKAKEAKTAVDEVAKSIADLEEELALFGQSEAFVKAFKLEGLGATTEQIEQYRAKLEELERLKTADEIQKTVDELVKQRDEIGKTNDQLVIQKLALQGASSEQLTYVQIVLRATDAAKQQQDAIEEGKRVFEDTRTPLETYVSTIEKLNNLLERSTIDWDTYMRAVKKAQDTFDDATKNGKKNLDDLSQFAIRAAENIQDQLANSIEQVFKGNFKDIDKAFADLIIRMAAQATAAQLGKALFGDFGKSNEIGGIFGDIGKFFTSSNSGSSGGGFWSSIGSLFSGFFADGGYIPPGQWGIAGEQGAEPVFGGRTGVTVQPNKPAGQTLNVYVQAAPNMSRDTALQQGAQIGLGLQRSRRNT